ncbi:MAG TPA: glutaredoxin family protein [Actinomycetota bacterium]|nr:glutaredoxin family protein [Actinomycetota bacterium]
MVPVGGSAPGPTVLMYSRRTCGLCDEARAVIGRESRRGGFRFEEVFVDGDEELERRYGLRVPVILVDGVEAFEYEVDPHRLRVEVARARSRRA